MWSTQNYNNFSSESVTATFREPIEGWISNFSGANGAFAGIVAGVVRCLKLNKNTYMDLVYGDYVVNGALAAAFEVYTGKNADPPIYNIVSSNDYKVTFGKSNHVRSLLICKWP